MKHLGLMTEPELKVMCDMMACAVLDSAKIADVEEPHFVLLLFNDRRLVQFVCNCQRGDVIKALQQCADSLERQEEVPR